MAKLTNYGAAALANAAVNGVQIPWTTLKLGDGNGSIPDFAGSEIALVHEVTSVPITAVYRRSDNPNFIYIEAIVPWNNGGYTIRECAATDAAGNVFVIGSYAEIPKPADTSEDARQIVIRLIAQVSPANISSIMLFDTGGSGMVISTTGVLPIGSVAEFAYAGAKFTDESNLEWLLQGLLHSKDGYTKAKSMIGLRSYGRHVYTASAATAGEVTQAADDGVGNIVIACGNAASVMVSHDFGDNFSAVAHSHGEKVTAVVFVGGQFILGSNSASAIKTSYSTDGAASFSAASTARSIANGVADTARGASNGSLSAFCAAGAAEVVFKSSGASNTPATLPGALSSSYKPMIEVLNNEFVFTSKNTSAVYKTANGGSSFGSMLKPISAVVVEEFRVALGKLFWLGTSGSNYIVIKYSSNLVDWFDLIPLMPEPAKSNASLFVGQMPRIFKTETGLLVVTQFGNYHTTDLVNFDLIKFSRSPVELSSGDGPQYFCYKNIVCAGSSLNEAQGGSNTSILKVNYAEPDYIGMHSSGVYTPQAHSSAKYVRIK